MSHASAIIWLVVPNRRWFQFSLRTFLVVLTVFGIWLGLHVRSANRQKEAVAVFKGAVYYDFQEVAPGLGFDPTADSCVPQWLLCRMGVDFFHDVVSVELFVHIYSDRRELWSTFSTLRSDVLRHLEAFPDLRALSLGPSQIITDEEMKLIGGLHKLESLRFYHGNQITEEDLVYLGGLTRLEDLCLLDTQMTAKGLKHLTELTNLKVITLSSNHCDMPQVREALPNCRIDADW